MKQRQLSTGIFLLSIVSLICISCSDADQNATNDDRYAGFQDPGNAARPRVWWHWMNGNITKDGIRKDLKWHELSRLAFG